MDPTGPATGARRRVRQEDEEGAPSRVTDRLRQMALLEHVALRHVLMSDRVVLAYQRRLLLEVLSPASHPLMRLGQQGHRLPSTMAPALPPSDAERRCAVLSAPPLR